MSLESAIQQLANAMERNQELPAVREIIRQRDEALEMHRRVEINWKWSEEQRDKMYWRYQTECRRVRALKAVIRKLKESK